MAQSEDVPEEKLSPAEAYNKALGKESTQEALRKLKEMIIGEKNLKVGLDEQFLMKFLWVNNLNPEKAFEKITLFYRIRFDYKSYFCHESPMNYRHLFGLKSFRLLKNRDKDGRLVVILYQGNVDPSKATFEEMARLDDIVWHLFLEDEQTVKTRGGVIIMVGSGFRWQLLKWVTPRNILLSVKKFQAFPLNQQHTHCYDITPLLKGPINIMYMMVKNMEIGKNVFFHYRNIASLHEHVDPAILPKDLGGLLDESEAFVDSEEYIAQRESKLTELHSYGYYES